MFEVFFCIAKRTGYEYMKLLNEKANGNFKTLVVDDKDCFYSLPFAKKSLYKWWHY